MKKHMLVWIFVLWFGLGGAMSAASQTEDTVPTIVFFTADMDTLTVGGSPAEGLTVGDAESGDAAISLSWYAAAFTEAHHLELQAYVLDAWQTLLPDAADPEPLPIAAERAVPVVHPADFGLPAYRLVIKEEGAGVIDAHVLTLPYADTEALTPAIAVFTADESSFDPAALARNEATVTVAWEVAGRPPDANLMFEQVLGSGVAVSVEQPRAHLWVPSVGEGAVVLKPASEEIRLRLRLVDMPDGVLLDEKELAFAVDAASMARIRSFSALTESVDAAALRSGEARVAVTWEVLNRPETANLVFEQVLDGGRAVSVELPRDDPMVPSVGRGEVAPVMPEDETADSITLRLRVVDTASGHTLDQRTLALPLAGDTSQPAVAPTPPSVAGRPAIVSFLAGAQTLGAAALRDGSARVTVSWDVSDRPETANLVFEQVLPGGIAYSVELPRDAPMVPSSGRGEVAPTYAPDEVVLRLRLVDMEGETLLDERRLRIPVEADAPAPGAPEVVSFTAESEPVERGGTVTLSWEVRGAERVALWKLNPNGQYAGWIEDQPAAGTWTGEIPEVYMDAAPFQLYAESAAGVGTYADLIVDIACPYTYFFTPPPAVFSCPGGEAETFQAALQAFERGYMIWRADTDQIYVMASQSRALVRYPDTWEEGESLAVSETPPAGLLEPTRGFGKVWSEHERVQQMLGWATAEEKGYTMTVQPSGASEYARTYFTWPVDGRILYIQGNTWGFLREEG